LHVPDNVPVRRVEVLVAIEPRKSISQEDRQAAAEADCGALRDFPGSTEEFLAERREDERWRDKALREAAGDPPNEGA